MDVHSEEGACAQGERRKGGGQESVGIGGTGEGPGGNTGEG